eukprot:CFRG5153T1
MGREQEEPDCSVDNIESRAMSPSLQEMEYDMEETTRLLKGVLNVDVRPIGYKDVADELRGIKDLNAFAKLERPAVVLNLRQATPRHIVKELVSALVSTGQLPPSLEDDAVRSAVGSSPALGLALGGAYGVGRPSLAQYHPEGRVSMATSSDNLKCPSENLSEQGIGSSNSIISTASTDITGEQPIASTSTPAYPNPHSNERSETLRVPGIKLEELPIKHDIMKENAVRILENPSSMGLELEASGGDSSAIRIRRTTEDSITLENSHWNRTIQGPAFLIAMAEVNGLDHVVTAFGRLANATNLGAVNESVSQFVCLVLGPSYDIKETKSTWENARNFASLLSNETFFSSALDASTATDIQSAVSAFATAKTLMKSRDVGGVSEDKENSSGINRTGKFAGGLIADIKRKLPWYLSDWTDGLVPWNTRSALAYLSSIVFLYFAIIMPSISFGALNNSNTDQNIGVIETLFSQAVCGAVFALFAGQPLTIIMTTGPLTIYIQVLYSWSDALGISFLPFFAWVGIWTSVILCVIVVTDACALISYVDAFTEEIFGFLISAIFVGEFVKPLVQSRQDDSTEAFLLNLVLSMGTYLIAYYLLMVKRSFLLRPIIRTLVSDFGAPIAIIIMSGMKYAFDVTVDMLELPTNDGFVTTSGRSWLVPMGDIGVGYVCLAIIPAALLTTLFFLDQNISTMLVMKPSNKLKKGPGYNLDLFVVAIMVIFCSVLGLPWCHAALPQSPMHARSLADVEEYAAHGRRYERVVKARETRVTGFVTHILIGLSILAKNVLNKIPMGVLWGFFLYMGLTSLDGNQMWERVILLFTQEEKYPPNHYVRRVPVKLIHLYTLLQVVLLLILWFFKANFYLGDTIFNAGLLFPLIIAFFVPIRQFLLPRYYSPREIKALTSEGEDFSNEGINV